MVVELATTGGVVQCRALPAEGAADGESLVVELRTSFDEERRTAQSLWIEAQQAEKDDDLGRAFAAAERIVREFPYNPRLVESAEGLLAELRRRAEGAFATLRDEASEAEYFESVVRDLDLAARAADFAEAWAGTRFGEQGRELSGTVRSNAADRSRSREESRAATMLARGTDLAENGHAALARLVLESVVRSAPQSDVAKQASDALARLPRE